MISIKEQINSALLDWQINKKMALIGAGLILCLLLLIITAVVVAATTSKKVPNARKQKTVLAEVSKSDDNLSYYVIEGEPPDFCKGLPASFLLIWSEK